MKKFLILPLSLLLICQTHFSQVERGDSLALVDLYYQCNGLNWNNSNNWLKGPVKSWSGIITEGSRVTSVSLQSNNLTGVLPPRMGNLTALTVLSLGTNDITDISVIQSLSSLTRLMLNDNKIADINPIGSLSSLNELYLSYNPITDLSFLNNMSSLTILTLVGCSITDISPIQNLVNLKNLSLQANDITDITPIQSLDSLIGINISMNRISDISPVGNLTNLERLYIEYNDITDIDLVRDLHKLITIGFSYNHISDISCLENLTNLRSVRISGNPVSDLSALVNNPGMDSLDYILAYNCPLSYEALNHQIMALRARFVRVSVSLIDDQPCNIQDSLALVSLYNNCNGQNWIFDRNWLTDSIYRWYGVTMTGNRIRSLGFSYNNLDGPLPFELSDLSVLESLSLGYNQITDFSSIADLPKLLSLNLVHNNIKNIPPMGGFDTLRYLSLNFNPVENITNLAQLKKITSLSLGYCKITDISPLSGLLTLENLQLDKNRIGSLSSIKNLTNLRYLSLRNCNVNDLEPLSGMTKLEFVSIQFNQISNIDVIKNFSLMRSLRMDYNKISDLSSLQNLDTLQFLNINDNKIKSLNPLVPLTDLRYLYLANNLFTNKTLVYDYPVIRSRLERIDQEQSISDLEIKYPNASYGVYPGKKIDISWKDFGGSGHAENINLFYSVDSGSTWTCIDSSAVNDSSYLWIVPDLGGNPFLLLIEDADVPEYVRDTSEFISTCDLVAQFNSLKNNLEITFSNTSIGTAGYYNWDFGDGSSSNLENPVHTYSRTDIYTVCLTIKDAETGCSSSYCAKVEAGDVACKADFSFSITDSIKKVTFTDLSTGIIETRNWDFGDNTFSTENSPEHIYRTDGVYHVCLKVLNKSTGYISTECKDIIITSQPEIVPPVASFTYLKNDTALRIDLVNTTTGDATSYYWTFGDGSYYSGQETSHIYVQYGTYEVCLYATNSETGINSSECKPIQIGNPPCTTIASFDYMIDEALHTVSFFDRSSEDVTDWNWNFGDSKTSTKDNPVHTYSQPGKYNVSLTVKNASIGCTDFTSEVLLLGDIECLADFSYNVDASKKMVNFRNESTGNDLVFYWEFGDGNNSQETDPVHSYLSAGNYTVSLTTSDMNGWCMDRKLESIQIQDIECIAGFIMFVDSASKTVTLTPDVTGTFTSLLWELGDGYTSSQENLTHTFSMPGYYTIGLTTYNADNGCMDHHEEVVLIVESGIDIYANFIYSIDDESLTVRFNNTSQNGNGNFTWDFGDDKTSAEINPVHTFSRQGSYQICLTAFGDNNMQSMFCRDILVSPSDKSRCQASFYSIIDSAALTGYFTDQSTGSPDSWSWDFESSGTSQTKDPLYTWSEPGFWVVHLRSLSTVTGCYSDAYELVNVGMSGAGLTASFNYSETENTSLKNTDYPYDFYGVTIGDYGKIHWDFGDGTENTTTLSPHHIYYEAKSYQVCFTASDPNTGQSDSYCRYIQVETPTSAEPVPEIRPGNISKTNFKAYPNPMNGYLDIFLNLPERQHVFLAMYNIQGRCVSVLINSTRDPGEIQQQWQDPGLESGMYFLVLINEEGKWVEKIIKE